MPDIQIYKEWLDDADGRLYVVNHLYAFMAYPDLETERGEVDALGKTIYAHNLLKHYSETDHPISADTALEWFQLAWRSPPSPVESSATTKRVDEGMCLAAELMQALWQAHLTGNLHSFWGKNEGIFINIMGVKLQKGRSRKNLERIWQRIRPVAHLYLASQYLRKIHPTMPRPCDQNLLLNFIALAEKFRSICESQKPYRCRETIMDSKASFRLIPIEFSIKKLTNIFE